MSSCFSDKDVFERNAEFERQETDSKTGNGWDETLTPSVKPASSLILSPRSLWFFFCVSSWMFVFPRCARCARRPGRGHPHHARRHLVLLHERTEEEFSAPACARQLCSGHLRRPRAFGLQHHHQAHVTPAPVHTFTRWSVTALFKKKTKL